MSSTPQEPKKVEQAEPVALTKEKQVSIRTLIATSVITGILSFVLSIFVSNLGSSSNEKLVSTDAFIGIIATLIGIIVALAIGFQIYNSLDSKRSIEKLIEQVEKKISDYDVEHNRLKDKVNNIEVLKRELKFTMNYIQMNQCSMIIRIMFASEKGKIGYNQAIFEALITGLKYRLDHDSHDFSNDIKQDKIIHDLEFYTFSVILIIYDIINDKDNLDIKNITKDIPTYIENNNIRKHTLYSNVKFQIEEIYIILEKLESLDYNRELINNDNYLQTIFKRALTYLDNE